MVRLINSSLLLLVINAYAWAAIKQNLATAFSKGPGGLFLALQLGCAFVNRLARMNGMAPLQLVGMCLENGAQIHMTRKWVTGKKKLDVTLLFVAQQPNWMDVYLTFGQTFCFYPHL